MTSRYIPWLLMIALQPASGAAQDPAAQANYRALLDQYCVDCHDPIENRGGLTLDDVDLAKVDQHARILERVVSKLRASAMPPVGKPRPDPATYNGFAQWLELELDRNAALHANPGRPATYRLNRTQYRNAIRDLVALDVDVEAMMAPDSSSYGFDNIADVLGISPDLLEGYLAAAERISAIAVGDPEMAAEDALYRVSQRYSQADHIEGMPPGTRGGLIIDHYFPLDGTYEFNTSFLKNTEAFIRGLQFPHQIEVSVDGRRAKLVTMGGTSDYVTLLENPTAISDAIEERVRVRMPLTAGTHRIVITFVRKSGAREVDPFAPFQNINFDPIYFGGIPSVDSVRIRGPADSSIPSVATPSRKAIFTCMPANARQETRCAEQILSRLARAAYRRPVKPAEVAVLMDFYGEGRQSSGRFEGGIQLGLNRILSSPNFIFRMESDPKGIAPQTSFRISDLELASRLSFFLWSSIPDEALIDLAAAGKLRNPAILEQQVRRMLADPRASSLATVFAAQWLHLRNLDGVEPDTLAFPNFDETLREAFRTETLMFFESIMRDDRSIVELLTADYTFMNERLARHYQVSGVYGSDFRKVQLHDEARRGLLGHGSVLTVTSMPNRTSPVKRGAWVLENLLAYLPPAPPDNVPGLEENSPLSLDPKPLRERLEQHRADPACASCHNILDPIGFSMEVFDGIGTKRTKDDTGALIDASGNLANGTPISGVEGLRSAITADPGNFAAAFTEKLLTYAIGRGLEYYDMPTVRSIEHAVEQQDYRFSALVVEIVKSMPFQMKMSAGPASGTTAANRPTPAAPGTRESGKLEP
jgi:Protein of unknown function (DUF1592)/Protein of unknown function (DUF1588)/Protein of unknown function (DUF1585)/Protein of unknown function (DUF1587)/Protein of unknown function (DUF1595)/Planctomycete cytochrome C